ncbi:MAG: flagellar motor protein MotB, partial [Eubacteriales bacterium]
MARRKNKEPEAPENSERWLITYSDLITLLMIFFVVMYSMSKVDANKFRAMADALSITMGGGTPAQMDMSTSPAGPSLIDSGSPLQNSQVPGPDNPPVVNPDQNYPDDQDSGTGEGTGKYEKENYTIEGIKAKLDEFATSNNIQTKLISSIEERGLVVSIQDTLLFDSGSAIITPTAHTILEKISTVLAATPNYIKIEGHTDNLPIHTAQFSSNWELSVLRATNVVQL